MLETHRSVSPLLLARCILCSPHGSATLCCASRGGTSCGRSALPPRRVVQHGGPQEPCSGNGRAARPERVLPRKSSRPSVRSESSLDSFPSSAPLSAHPQWYPHPAPAADLGISRSGRRRGLPRRAPRLTRCRPARRGAGIRLLAPSTGWPQPATPRAASRWLGRRGGAGPPGVSGRPWSGRASPWLLPTERRRCLRLRRSTTRSWR